MVQRSERAGERAGGTAEELTESMGTGDTLPCPYTGDPAMHDSIYHDGRDSGEWDGETVSEGYEVWFADQTMKKATDRPGLTIGWYGEWKTAPGWPVGPFNTRIEAISFFEQEIANGAYDEQFG